VDTGTLWVATGAGRVFISHNGDAAASAVTFSRIDNTAANSPGRFITGITIDPANSNHAWVSFSGYNVNTPAQPGHVFEVTWSGTSATWADRSYNLPDLPITSLVRDDLTGDLYAGNDFGVIRLAHGSTTWTVAGTGLPNVEVPGLTIVPSARLLYAPTHGRSAWLLQLPLRTEAVASRRRSLKAAGQLFEEPQQETYEAGAGRVRQPSRSRCAL
jgi:hypothetical protein